MKGRLGKTLVSGGGWWVAGHVESKTHRDRRGNCRQTIVAGVMIITRVARVRNDTTEEEEKQAEGRMGGNENEKRKSTL